MLNRIYNKIVAAIRTYGFLKAIYWLIFGYFKINKFYVYHMSLNLELMEDYDGELSVKMHLPSDIDTIRSNQDFNTYEVLVSSYLRTSGCLIGYCDQKPAHVMWIFRQGDDSRLFDLKLNEAELNYCYTPESFRGKGIYTRMIRKAAITLKHLGVEELYMATHETNIPAQKAISRAGLMQIGIVKNIGIFHRPKWSSSWNI